MKEVAEKIQLGGCQLSDTMLENMAQLKEERKCTQLKI